MIIMFITFEHGAEELGPKEAAIASTQLFKCIHF